MQRPSSAQPRMTTAVVAQRHTIKSPSPPLTGRSRSSSAERWAAVGSRLAIRRAPAFPMQRRAPRPYLTACADMIKTARDWNAEYQLACEMSIPTLAQAEHRHEQLCRISAQFEDAARHAVEQIVRLDDDGPVELPKFLHCYRIENIFFRVLPDSRSGRNYIAALRGVVESQRVLLSVPLTAMFMYRGMPVLVQALVPMPRELRQVYGPSSSNTSSSSSSTCTQLPEVEAEMLLIAEALHIPRSSAELMEVYEGLDGRYYATTCNTTLTPLFVDDSIMKRQEMLRICPMVVDGVENTIAMLRNFSVQDALVAAVMAGHPSGTSSTKHNNTDATKDGVERGGAPSASSSTSPPLSTEQMRRMCSTLHHYGINLCLMKQVVAHLRDGQRATQSEVAHVMAVVGCEMMCRSIKQEFYTEVQGKRLAYSDAALSRALARHLGAMFVEPVERFQSCALERIAKKFGIVDEDDDWIELLTSGRHLWRAVIGERVCQLLGASLVRRGATTDVVWASMINGRVLPSITAPHEAQQLAQLYTSVVQTDYAHRYAYCLPLMCVVEGWQHHLAASLTAAKEAAQGQRGRRGPEELAYWSMQRLVLRVLWRCARESGEAYAEGLSILDAVQNAYARLSSRKTQGCVAIEAGFGLLGAAPRGSGGGQSPARLRQCVESAAEQFHAAIRLLPDYLRSEHGAWLHLQPYMGLLQCRKMLPSCSVKTMDLVAHVMELSRIGWASDVFAEFCWELGAQLEQEGFFGPAATLLTRAVELSKAKPTFAADLHRLLMDLAHVLRSWDLHRNYNRCMELMSEAAQHAEQHFGSGSREYAVVLNNRGSLEIEAERFDEARHTLEMAGRAFAAAKVAHDDPDYIAYLHNLALCDMLPSANTSPTKQHKKRKNAAASLGEGKVDEDAPHGLGQLLHAHANGRPPKSPRKPGAQRRGMLRRWPFLANACANIPFDDVDVLHDRSYVLAARQYARCTDPVEREELQQRMQSRVWELFRELEAGAMVRRLPCLPAILDGIHVEGLRLGADRISRYWMKLVEHNNAPPHPTITSSTADEALPAGDAQQQRRRAEYEFRAMVEQRAASVGVARQFLRSIDESFMERFGDFINVELPIAWEDVLRDAAFSHLAERLAVLHARRAATPQQSAEDELEVQRVEAALRQRVDELEMESWAVHEALRPWLAPTQLAGATLRDLCGADYLHELLEECGKASKTKAALVQRRCAAVAAAVAERSSITRLAQLVDGALVLERCPNLAPHPDLAELAEEVLLPATESPFVSASSDAMATRCTTAAAIARLAKTYPNVREAAESMHITNLPPQPHLFSYEAAAELERRPQDHHAPHHHNGGASSQHAKMQQLCTQAAKARAGCFRARWYVESCYPFLQRRYLGLPIADLHLHEDEAFASAHRIYIRHLLEAHSRVAAEDVDPLIAVMRDRAAARAASILKDSCQATEQLRDQLGQPPSLPSSSSFIAVAPTSMRWSLSTTEVAALMQLLTNINTANDQTPVAHLVQLVHRTSMMLQLHNLIDEEDLHEEHGCLAAELPPSNLGTDTMSHALLCQPVIAANVLHTYTTLQQPCADMKSTVSQLDGDFCHAAVELHARRLALHRSRPPHLPAFMVGIPTEDLMQRSEAPPLNAEPTEWMRMAMLVAREDEHHRQRSATQLTHSPPLQYAQRLAIALHHLHLDQDAAYQTLERHLTSPTETASHHARLRHRADELAATTLHACLNIHGQVSAVCPGIQLNDLIYLHQHPNTLAALLQDITRRDSHDSFQRLQQHIQHTQNQQDDDAANTFYAHLQQHPTTHHSPPATETPNASATAIAAQVAAAAAERGLRAHEGLGAEDIQPGFSSMLLDDDEFNRLAAQRDDILKASKYDPAALKAVEDAMDARAAAIAAQGAAAAAERGLGAHEGLGAEDIQPGFSSMLLDDDEFNRLAAQRDDILKASKYDPAALKAVEDAMDARAAAIAAQGAAAAAERGLGAHEGLGAEDIQPGFSSMLLDDDEFNRLAAQRDDILKASKYDPAALKAVEDAMDARAAAIAAQVAAAAAERGLGAHEGLGAEDIQPGFSSMLLDDDEFNRLAAQRDDILKASKYDPAALKAVEDAMDARAAAIAAQVAAAAAERGLGAHEGLGAEDIQPGFSSMLLDDDEFNRLAAQRDDILKASKYDPAALKAVEDAMDARAAAIAAQVAAAAAERGLRAHEGLGAEDIQPGFSSMLLDDDEFNRLAAQRDDILKASKYDPAALKAVEDAMDARAAAIAAQVAAAAAERGLGAHEGLGAEDIQPGFSSMLLDDDEFNRLAAQRDDILKASKYDPAALKAVEDAMDARAAAIAAQVAAAAAERGLGAHEGLGAEDIQPGFSSMLLDDDEFNRLAAQRDDILKASKYDPAALKAVEDAMDARAAAIAAQVAAAAAERGLGAHEGLGAEDIQPGFSSMLLDDDEFNRLAAQRDDILKASKYDPAALKAVEDAMDARAAAIAAQGAAAAAERGLGAHEGLGAEDIQPGFSSMLLDDDEFNRLAAQRDDILKASKYDPAALKAVEDAMDARAAAIAAQVAAAAAERGLRAHEGLGAEDIQPGFSSMLLDDDEFNRLAAQRDDILKASKYDPAALKAVEDAMDARAAAIAAQVAAAAAERGLGAHEGLGAEDIQPGFSSMLLDDDEFNRLAAQRDDILKASKYDPAALKAVEDAMDARAAAIAAQVAAAAAERGLRAHEGLGAEDIQPGFSSMLLDDDEFNRLAAQRDDILKASKYDPAALKAVEDAMDARAAAIAAQVAAAAAERGLGAHEGLGAEDIQPGFSSMLLDDDEFNRLAAQRDDILKASKYDPAALKAVEDAMDARAVAIAAQVAAAAAERGLGAHEGLGAEDIQPGFSSMLLDDDEFNRLAAQRDDILKASKYDPAALKAVEDAMDARAVAIAAQVAAAAAERGLGAHEGLGAEDIQPGFSSMLLDDDEFNRLAAQRDDILKASKYDPAALKAVEDAMDARAAAIAAQVAAAAAERGLRAHEGLGAEDIQPGFSSMLLDDDEFNRLAAQRDDILKASKYDPAALKAVEDAMDARAAAIAAQVAAAAAERGLRAHEGLGAEDIQPGFSSMLLDDDEFNRLAAQRDDILKASKYDPAALKAVEDAMDARAAAIAAQVAAAAAERGLGAHEGLGAEDIQPGFSSMLLDDDEFNRLAAQRDDILKASKYDPAALKAVEDAMDARAVAIAAQVAAAAAERGLGAHEGLGAEDIQPGFSSMLLDDDEFNRLAAQRDDILKASKYDPAALKAVEDAMDARAVAIAAQVAAAAAERGLGAHEGLGAEDIQPGFSSMLLDDDEFNRLAAQRDDILKASKYDPAALKAVEDAMDARAAAIAAQVAAAAAERGLRAHEGLGAEDIQPGFSSMLLDDDEFNRLAAQRDDILKASKYDPAALKAVEDAMDARAAAIALTAISGGKLGDIEEMERAAIEEDAAADRQGVREQMSSNGVQALVAAEERERAAIEQDAAADVQGVREQMSNNGVQALFAAEKRERAAIEQDAAADIQGVREQMSSNGVQALVAAEKRERAAIEQDAAADVQGVREQMSSSGVQALVAAEKRERSAIEQDAAADVQGVREQMSNNGVQALVTAEKRERAAIEQDAAADVQGVREQMSSNGVQALVTAEKRERAAIEQDAAADVQGVREQMSSNGVQALVAAEKRERSAIEQYAAADVQGVREQMSNNGVQALVAAEKRERAAIEQDAAAHVQGVREQMSSNGVQSLVAAEKRERAAIEQDAAAHVQGVREQMSSNGVQSLVAAEKRERAAIEQDAAADVQGVREQMSNNGVQALVAAEKRERSAIEQDAAADVQGVREQMSSNGVQALVAAEKRERAAIEQDAAADVQGVREQMSNNGVQALVAAEKRERAAIEQDAAADVQGVREQMSSNGVQALVAAEKRERAAIEQDAAADVQGVREQMSSNGVQSLVAAEKRERAAIEQDAAADVQGVREQMSNNGVQALVAAEKRERSAIEQDAAADVQGVREQMSSNGVQALVAAEKRERAAIEQDAAADVQGVREQMSSNGVQSLVAAEKRVRAAIEQDAAADVQGVREQMSSNGVQALVAAEKRERAAIEQDAAADVQGVREQMSSNGVQALVAAEKRERSAIEQDAAADVQGVREQMSNNGVQALVAAEKRERAAIEQDAAADARGRCRALEAAVADEKIRASQRNVMRACEEDRGGVERAEVEDREGVVRACVEGELLHRAFDVGRSVFAVAAVGEALGKAIGDESAQRKLVEVDEADAFKRLSSDGACVHALAGAARVALPLAVSVGEAESVARMALELDEKGDRELLRSSYADWNVTVARTLSKAAAKVDAAKEVPLGAAPALAAPVAPHCVQQPWEPTLLQRVGRGFCLRRRLGKRFANRLRSQLQSNVAHLVADEFHARRRVVEEEQYRRGMLNKMGGTTRPPRPHPPTGGRPPSRTSVAPTEDGSVGRRASLDASGRHSRDGRRRGRRPMTEEEFQVHPRSPSSPEDDRMTGLADSIALLPVAVLDSSGMAADRSTYGGYEVDPLCRFLLQHEEELHRLRRSVEMQRQRVAVEHDRLKEQRDRAAEEAAYGVSGAQWVPTRPLPLSDYVRGPSVQYAKTSG